MTTTRFRILVKALLKNPRVIVSGAFLLLMTTTVIGYWQTSRSNPRLNPASRSLPQRTVEIPSRFAVYNNRTERVQRPHSLTVHWGQIPRQLQEHAAQAASGSNIHSEDYAGSDACQTCHQKNYDSWSTHPHRWMNAMADEQIVKGDFDDVQIQYLQGTVRFFREDGEFRMCLTREAARTYQVRQTLGSRFFQYYIGRLIDGPEPESSSVRTTDHVLPLGYWIEKREWIPVVHIWGDERPDGERLDPFDAASYSREFTAYAEACNHCHTTFPLAELLSAGKADRVAFAVPENLHWSASGYLEKTLTAPPESYSTNQFVDLLMARDSLEAPEHAVELGIGCEACHLGGREHVANPRTPPRFFPHSPHLVMENSDSPDAGTQVDYGRTHRNLNWACGRCHSGARPMLAAGMATWNSTEYTDAMKGACYSKLKCVDCHNPHEAIGRKWEMTIQNENNLCIRCHEQLRDSEAVRAHTHHAVDGEGSRCMNCHMPRLNEGMQDVVRTHMIFSPTDRRMIEANHPNACNQCHTEESIDWTLQWLKEWYGHTYDEARLSTVYQDRQKPAAIGWLQSNHESVRLIAADSLFRSRATWAISKLIDALDDPFLLNRQFAREGVQAILGIRLEDFGYRFYMTPDERRPVIPVIHKHAETIIQQTERPRQNGDAQR